MEKSILVVDDDAEVRSLVCEFLSACGYKVREAENGEEALKAYKAERASAVLLDMFMPEKDGIETLCDLLKHDPTACVIAMTGGGKLGVDVLKPARSLGAKNILHKPIAMTELQHAIEEALAT